MVVVEVHSKCIKTTYKSYLCSQSTVFVVISNLVSIIIPFILAYNSRGFWIKHDTFYEQPSMRFMGQYLFQGITSNISSPVVCSNFPYFRDFSHFDKCSVIQVKEIDYNKDGKVDEFEFKITLEEQVQLTSFCIILTFDYRLNAVCPTQMQSALILEEEIRGKNVKEVDTIANVKLQQKFPLFCHPKWRNNRYNYSIIENNNAHDFSKIISDYMKRNVSTYLNNKRTTFQTNEGDSELAISLKAFYPDHHVYYIPSFWQIVKWAWVQFFSIYIVFAWIVHKIKNYVFENKIVLFYEASPLKKLN